MIRRPPRSTLFPSPTLCRPRIAQVLTELDEERGTAGNRLYYFAVPPSAIGTLVKELGGRRSAEGWVRLRSEEHTAELQSPCNLVCRLLLGKKKRQIA